MVIAFVRVLVEGYFVCMVGYLLGHQAHLLVVSYFTDIQRLAYDFGSLIRGKPSYASYLCNLF